MNTLVIKIILSLVGLGSILGIGYWINSLIQERAVLEATLASTTKAFGEYATNVEAEVEGYRQSTIMLSNEYQKARDNRDDFFASIEERDLDKMAKRHPDNLMRILNGRTFRLLESISKANDYSTQNSKTASPTKTR